MDQLENESQVQEPLDGKTISIISSLQGEFAGYEDQIELLYLLSTFEDQLTSTDDNVFDDIEFFIADNDNTFDLIEAAPVKAGGIFCIISPNGDQTTWVLKTGKYNDPYITLTTNYNTDTEEEAITTYYLQKYHYSVCHIPVIKISHTLIALSNLDAIQKTGLNLLRETLPLDLSKYLPQDHS